MGLFVKTNTFAVPIYYIYILYIIYHIMISYDIVLDVLKFISIVYIR